MFFAVYYKTRNRSRRKRQQNAYRKAQGRKKEKDRTEQSGEDKEINAEDRRKEFLFTAEENCGTIQQSYTQKGSI